VLIFEADVTISCLFMLARFYVTPYLRKKFFLNCKSAASLSAELCR
jgi:hypothetical protein